VALAHFQMTQCGSQIFFVYNGNRICLNSQ